MNVITLASRKGGAGKSTLTAHLAGYAHAQGHRTLVIDADPQGSLTLWHAQRRNGEPRLQSASRGVERAVAYAMVEGYEWVFIDTAPTMWLVVQEAIRAATLVVDPGAARRSSISTRCSTPSRPRATLDKPYAVVLNAAPSKRDDKEAPVVAQSRAFLDRHDSPGVARPDQPARKLCAAAGGGRQRLRGRARDAGRRRDRVAVALDRALGRRHQCRACGCRWRVPRPPMPPHTPRQPPRVSGPAARTPAAPRSAVRRSR